MEIDIGYNLANFDADINSLREAILREEKNYSGFHYEFNILNEILAKAKQEVLDNNICISYYYLLRQGLHPQSALLRMLRFFSNEKIFIKEPSFFSSGEHFLPKIDEERLKLWKSLRKECFELENNINNRIKIFRECFSESFEKISKMGGQVSLDLSGFTPHYMQIGTLCKIIKDIKVNHLNLSNMKYAMEEIEEPIDHETPLFLEYLNDVVSIDLFLKTKNSDNSVHKISLYNLSLDLKGKELIFLQEYLKSIFESIGVSSIYVFKIEDKELAEKIEKVKKDINFRKKYSSMSDDGQEPLELIEIKQMKIKIKKEDDYKIKEFFKKIGFNLNEKDEGYQIDKYMIPVHCKKCPAATSVRNHDKIMFEFFFSGENRIAFNGMNIIPQHLNTIVLHRSVNALINSGVSFSSGLHYLKENYKQYFIKNIKLIIGKTSNVNDNGFVLEQNGVKVNFTFNMIFFKELLSNHLDEAGVLAIASAISENNALKSVDLSGLSIFQKIKVKSFFEIIAKSQSLEEIIIKEGVLLQRRLKASFPDGFLSNIDGFSFSSQGRSIGVTFFNKIKYNFDRKLYLEPSLDFVRDNILDAFKENACLERLLSEKTFIALKYIPLRISLRKENIIEVVLKDFFAILQGRSLEEIQSIYKGVHNAVGVSNFLEIASFSYCYLHDSIKKLKKPSLLKLKEPKVQISESFNNVSLYGDKGVMAFNMIQCLDAKNFFAKNNFLCPLVACFQNKVKNYILESRYPKRGLSLLMSSSLSKEDGKFSRRKGSHLYSY